METGDLRLELLRCRVCPLFRGLRSELERFGGTVEQCIGDAVVALFGAPTADVTIPTGP